MKQLFVAVLALFATSACVVGGHQIGAPNLTGSGASSSGAINSGDAEKIALKVAAEHGYKSPQVNKVHHDEGQGGRWKVEIRGLANGKDGKIDVRLDDVGKVIDVKDHQKADKGKDGDKKDKEEKDKGKKD
jgi:hypothetical protein